MANEVNVGAIAVEILARTEKLEAGLKGARGQIGAFSGALAGVTAGVTNFALQMGVKAVGAMAGWVTNSFAAIGAAQDLAIALNSDTQALQGLQYAAKNTGSDAATLNAALTKMNTNIGQGLAGNEKAAEGFDRLGLRIEDLAGMASTDAFGLIADEIAKLPTPAQQAQAAVDIFGKSASSLIPLLSEGSAGIEELQERYSMLSGGMSELDVSKVQLAGDLMDDLGIFVKGVADQIAVNLAPFLSTAVAKMIDLGMNGQSAVTMVGKGFTWLEGILKEVAWWTVKIYQGWLSFQYVFQLLEVAFTKWYSTIERGFNGISAFIKKATFGEVDFGTSDFFANWDRESTKALDATGSEILKLQSMLDKEAPQEFIGSIFEAVKTGADEAAQKIVDLGEKRRKAARDASQTMEREEKEKKLKEPKVNSNNFRQISMSLITPQFLGLGKQSIDKEQLSEQKKTNGLLKNIAATQKFGGATYA